MATALSKIQFDYKAICALMVLASMWYDLKTDFAVHKEEHKLLEYRIASLEQRRPVAIKPKETKLEADERDN